MRANEGRDKTVVKAEGQRGILPMVGQSLTFK